MIRQEHWYRVSNESWVGPRLTNPKTRSLLQRMRSGKWGRALQQAERLLSEIAASAQKGQVDSGTFDSILEALEANLDVMERRAELSAVRGEPSTIAWMQRASEKLTGWLSGYA